MQPDKRLAFDAAKEIVIAKMGNSSIHADENSGKEVADFFEQIYSRLLTITQKTT